MYYVRAHSTPLKPAVRTAGITSARVICAPHEHAQATLAEPDSQSVLATSGDAQETNQAALHGVRAVI